jgi:multiple sugar transport system ATP-binding protein
MATVEFRKLVKRYGTLEVVHAIDLTIGDGEFIVLVGPSGCGKSTTLRMLAGLEDISGGEILIDARAVNDIEPRDRDIAMVFQDYALYPHMSVYENMAFALRYRKAPRKEIDARVRDAAEILGLTPYLPAASVSASRWGGRSCASRGCSCSMNRCRISMPSCAGRCGWK